MACGCSKRTGKSARPSNAVYELVQPDGEVKTFLTMLEATRARRKSLGGTIRAVDASGKMSVSA